MKISFPALFLSIFLNGHLVLSKSCNHGITGSGECVTLFSGGGCQSGAELTEFVPTCEGNCFQFSSFDSVSVIGNGFLGTDCHVFADSNCQDEIADTGNSVGFECANAAGAQSMQCFFDC
ncbi:hypothetical protein FB451DRAFT_1292327 [Mycena latifolia]|nr:hypothetical protein FB451DRAFT_1292327 [Mycena latifolia]